jgi:hypothetical protein
MTIIIVHPTYISLILFDQNFKIYLSLFVRYLNHLNFKYNLSQYMSQMCHYVVKKKLEKFFKILNQHRIATFVK